MLDQNNEIINIVEYMYNYTGLNRLELVMGFWDLDDYTFYAQVKDEEGLELAGEYGADSLQEALEAICRQLSAT